MLTEIRIEDLPASDPRAGGYVYAIEREDGAVKVGTTTNPRRRVKNLQANFRHYANLGIRRVYLSPKHLNAQHNETSLLRTFAGCAVGGSELLITDLQPVVDAFAELPLSLDFGEAERRVKRASEDLVRMLVAPTPKSEGPPPGNERLRLIEDQIANCTKLIELTHDLLENLPHVLEDDLARLSILEGEREDVLRGL